MRFDTNWASKRNTVTSPSVIAIMANIVKSEGGYSNRAVDRGGPTNYGITLNTARQYGAAFDYDNDGAVTIADLKRITPVIAMAFYAMEYFYQPNIQLLPKDIWPIATDIAVNSGAARAGKLVQSALTSLGKTVAQDGKIGPATAKACADVCATLGSAQVINEIVRQRNDFFESIVKNDPTQIDNLNGWLNRSNRFKVMV